MVAHWNVVEQGSVRSVVVYLAIAAQRLQGSLLHKIKLGLVAFSNVENVFRVFNDFLKVR